MKAIIPIPRTSGHEPGDPEHDEWWAERPARSSVKSVLMLLAPVIGVLGFFVTWQLAIVIFDIKKFLLPSPIDVLRHLKSDPSFYVRNARTTLWEALLGFLLAFLVAMVVGTLMAHSRFIDRMLQPMAVLIQVTPLIAYAPAVVVWVGFGLRPILIDTVVVCFVPFLLNIVSGLRSVDPNLLELARSVDATRREVFFRLRVPSSLPFVFSAARINAGLALLGAVLGEFFSGSKGGLGFAIKIAINRNLSLQLWGSVFVLAALGAASILLIGTVERFALRWHASQRG